MRDFSARKFVQWLMTISLALVCMGSARAAVTSLDAPLDTIRQKLNLPGAAGVVLQGGVVVGEGVTGVRRLGAEEKIRIEDRFGVGSVTKRLTGLMIASLVDEGKLSYELTLAKALPGVQMREEYRNVTLEQLLTFTGGIPTYQRIGPKITPHLFDTEGTPAERRDKFVRSLLQENPVAPPGKEAHYSNASYTLAGQIAMAASGKDLEALIEERVFKPLALKRAGWGRPWAATRASEPWLHVARPDGYVPEPDMVRPPEAIFLAAGGAHMSMHDLAAFAQYELMALQGKDAVLKPATSKRWHAMEGRDGDTIVRAGGAPWLSACYLLWPKKNLVAAFAVNGGSPDDQACKAFVTMVKEKFGG